MTTEIKHSKLPKLIVGNNCLDIHTADSEFNAIATCFDKKKASEIVHCVNNFYPLVKILEKCLKDETNRRNKLLDLSTAACYSDERIAAIRKTLEQAKVVK